MEVELDVEPAHETWRQVAADWGSFCRETLLCHEDVLFKDEPFTPADWDRHRSWARHCPEPRILVRVLRTLAMVEIWVLAVSVFAALYAHFLQPKDGWPTATSENYMIVFTLTSFALALLMVFRTNTAYARWWEARTAVGRWINTVRNSQRMLLSWAPASEAHLVREFARWNAVLTPAACAYLCRRACYWELCEDLLQPGELAWLSGCDNPPVKVLMVVSGLIKRSSLSMYERTAVEAELSAFDVALGVCERITRQAIPRAYTRHTSRFLIVYLTFLPFALWPYLEWLMIPAMVVLAFLLIGIENIGVQIENPVRVLPMARFCVGNRTAALSMVKHHPDVLRTLDVGLAAAAAEQQQQPGSPMPGAARQAKEMNAWATQTEGAANGGHETWARSSPGPAAGLAPAPPPVMTR